MENDEEEEEYIEEYVEGSSAEDFTDTGHILKYNEIKVEEINVEEISF